jgi:hypothetical protein
MDDYQAGEDFQIARKRGQRSANALRRWRIRCVVHSRAPMRPMSVVLAGISDTLMSTSAL